MKALVTILFFYAFSLYLSAQPMLEFIDKEINLDTIPLRMIDGHKQMVLNVKFKNVGNAPLIVKDIQTVYTDYSMNRDYLYLPKKPIAPKGIDSIVVIILPELNGYPLYFYNPTVWEFSITSNAYPNYFRSMKAIWNTSKISIVPLSDMNEKHDQLVEGDSFNFKFIIQKKCIVSIVIDSIIYEAKFNSDTAQVRSVTEFPLVISDKDSIKISTLISTNSQFGEIRWECYVHYHYPNGQATFYQTSNTYEVIPNVNIKGPPQRDFNILQQGQLVEETFEVENKGTYSIKIHKGDDCTFVEKETLEPGKTTLIKVNYDSRFDTGFVNKTYRIQVRQNKSDSCCRGYNFKSKMLTMTLNGTVLPKNNLDKVDYGRFTDTLHDFGTINRGDLSSHKFFYDTTLVILDSFVFKNTSEYKINYFKARVNEQNKESGYINYSKNRTLLPGDSVKIYIRIVYRKRVTEFNNTIKFKYTIQHGCQEKECYLFLRVKGKVEGRFPKRK